MLPILSSAEMREADAREVARRGQDALVADAGTAVALTASSMLGSCYGRRVAVIAGPGLNGADGRVAARWLKSRGARVRVFDVGDEPAELLGYDLVIDAAFGLGCSRPYRAPHVPPTTLVVAVDLPSGVDADTGDVLGQPLRADLTVALGALKPAHVTGHAAAYAGELRVATVGIDVESPAGVVTPDDLGAFVRWSHDDHKWVHALDVVAGSARMPGAADLVTRGALAAGASMIRLTSREPLGAVALASEVVRSDGQVDRRSRAVVAGPGLGRDAAAWLSELLTPVRVPVVLDADGLSPDVLELPHPPEEWVLTPHDGEYERLRGTPAGSDRMSAARSLAEASDCVVVLKGPTTFVAAPDGRLRVVRSGTSALATAGTGDVLAGIIGASIARGHDAFEAAALGAFVHGLAGARLARYARAGDLPAAVAAVLSEHEPAPLP